MDLAHQFRTLGFGRSVQASRNASSNTAVVTGKAEVGLFGVKLTYNALFVEVAAQTPRKSPCGKLRVLRPPPPNGRQLLLSG